MAVSSERIQDLSFATPEQYADIIRQCAVFGMSDNVHRTGRGLCEYFAERWTDGYERDLKAAHSAGRFHRYRKESRDLAQKGAGV